MLSIDGTQTVRHPRRDPAAVVVSDTDHPYGREGDPLLFLRLEAELIVFERALFSVCLPQQFKSLQ